MSVKRTPMKKRSDIPAPQLNPGKVICFCCLDPWLSPDKINIRCCKKCRSHFESAGGFCPRKEQVTRKPIPKARTPHSLDPDILEKLKKIFSLTPKASRGNGAGKPSQKRLAEILGVTRGKISEWLRGYGYVSLISREKILKIYQEVVENKVKNIDCIYSEDES